MPADGGKAYSLYDAFRRMLEPLRRDWDKFTPAEREIVLKEIEAFLRSVKPDETPTGFRERRPRPTVENERRGELNPNPGPNPGAPRR